jgi:hypothetical protein
MCSWNDCKDWDEGYDSDVHDMSYSAYVAQDASPTDVERKPWPEEQQLKRKRDLEWVNKQLKAKERREKYAARSATRLSASERVREEERRQPMPIPRSGGRFRDRLGFIPERRFVYPRAGNPLWWKDAYTRGRIGEEVGKRFLTNERVKSIEMQPRGHKFDLLVTYKDGTTERLEFKLISISGAPGAYSVTFGSLHPGYHDNCYLCVNGLRKITIFEYGPSTVMTESFVAGKAAQTLEEAENTIIAKMEKGKRPRANRPRPQIKLVKTIWFDDPDSGFYDLWDMKSTSETLTPPTPMSLFPSQIAGDIVFDMTLKMLQDYGYRMRELTPEEIKSKGKRCKHTAPWDVWLALPGQELEKTEGKASNITTQSTKGVSGLSARSNFEDIKPELHTLRVLQLVVYNGIWVFFHRNNDDLTKQGQKEGRDSYKYKLEEFVSDGDQVDREDRLVKKLAAKCEGECFFMEFCEGDLELVHGTIMGTLPAAQCSSDSEHA